MVMLAIGTLPCFTSTGMIVLQLGHLSRFQSEIVVITGFSI